MRHYAHHIGDYRAHTAHLTFVEDAAYRRLLDLYYMHEKPLPPDLATVARLVGARTAAEKQAVVNVLTEFFEIEQDGYHQARADREIEVYRAKADAARENGTKGGRPPNRKKTKAVIPPVKSEKLTTPHEPSSVSKETGAGEPDAASVIFNQGLAWLIKSTGKPEGACRSLLGKWRKEVSDEKLIAALGRGQREAPIDAVAWMEKAIKFEAKQGSIASTVGAQPTADDWRGRVKWFREKGMWNNLWGPTPDQAGCFAPKELLQ